MVRRPSFPSAGLAWTSVLLGAAVGVAAEPPARDPAELGELLATYRAEFVPLPEAAGPHAGL
ncbi:MAG: hypothetical protein ACRDD1_21005, partial [Planctomycetia bacterium]